MAGLPLAPRSRFELPRADRALLSTGARVRALAVVRQLLEAPTAPYAEDLVLARLLAHFQHRPRFRCQLDPSANLLVELEPLAPDRRPPLAFSAHLDHPGFLYQGASGGAHRARFHGGVPERYFDGASVRLFEIEGGEACATARVAKHERLPDGGLEVELSEVEGRLEPGALGMWDLTPGTMRGARLEARVCDDLLGAAAIACALDQLAERDFPGGLLGIFTRAEETGFVGCQGLLRQAALPAGTSVVGLECSPARATAKVGRGVVLRVGDAASVFDPQLTHHLQDCARELARSQPVFRFQRALMDGGRCESTAYNLWGVPAAGLCLALGNYHNCGRNGIAPEYVDWYDFEALVALLVHCAENFRSADSGAASRQRLDQVWQAERPLLAQSSQRIRGRFSAVNR